MKRLVAWPTQHWLVSWLSVWFSLWLGLRSFWLSVSISMWFWMGRSLLSWTLSKAPSLTLFSQLGSRHTLSRLACFLVPPNLRPRYARVWPKDFGEVRDRDGGFAAFRFAIGSLIAALGIRYPYASTSSELAALTTAKRTVNLGNAERTRRTIWRSVVVFLVLVLGSLHYNYSIEVAVGGVVLNILAAWITSD
jgi:hypothetical protein